MWKQGMFSVLSKRMFSRTWKCSLFSHSCVTQNLLDLLSSVEHGKLLCLTGHFFIAFGTFCSLKASLHGEHIVAALYLTFFTTLKKENLILFGTTRTWVKLIYTCQMPGSLFFQDKWHHVSMCQYRTHQNFSFLTQ